MELEILKELFSAHLSPIQADIKELKDRQGELIEIAKTQVRLDADLSNLQEHINECKIDRESMKKSRISFLWDTIKLLLAGLFGALLSREF